jgi:hypothetical protein
MNQVPNNDAGYVNFLKTHGLLSHIAQWNIDGKEAYYPIIYKICSVINSNQELELAASFLNKIYESGYYKSIQDHQAALEKLGLSTKISI